MMSDDRRPDWNYWKNVPNWTILEAVALSMDIDPKLVNYRTYRPLYGKEVTKRDESPEFEKRLSLAIENIENLAVKAVAGEYEKWKITRASFSALTRSLKWKVPPQMKARAEPDKREVEILNLKQQVEALTLERDKLPVDVPIKKSKKRSEAAIERHSNVRERTLAAVLAIICTADRESYIRSTDQIIIASKLAGLVEDTRANYEKDGQDGKILSLQGIEDLIRSIVNGKYFS